MKVEGKSYRSIWYDDKTEAVKIIDQRWLPHEFRIAILDTLQDFAIAISYLEKAIALDGNYALAHTLSGRDLVGHRERRLGAQFRTELRGGAGESAPPSNPHMHTSNRVLNGQISLVL